MAPYSLPFSFIIPLSAIAHIFRQRFEIRLTPKIIESYIFAFETSNFQRLHHNFKVNGELLTKTKVCLYISRTINQKSISISHGNLAVFCLRISGIRTVKSQASRRDEA